MFGGIAASGSERLCFATSDGSVLTIDVETGRAVGQFSLYPSGPEHVHVSACAVDADGTLLLGDARNHRVRRFAVDGRQLALVGGLPNPGLKHQDEPGVLVEPCVLLPLEDGLVVGCGEFDMKHGVQRFAGDGRYRDSFTGHGRGWKRAQGLARPDDTLWIAETEAGTIRRYELDGAYRGTVELHPDLKQPFRLAADGYGGVFMLLAPGDEAEQDELGVARLAADGIFEGWAVEAGEKPGEVYCPFDLAVLADGRFVVADLPLGSPPDVRVQVFSADGRLLRTLLEDRLDLIDLQKAWFESVLARRDRSAPTLYEQARVHHYYAGATPEHLAEARDLYRAACDEDPDFFLARLGLGTLLQQGLDDPAGAEQEYRAALPGAGASGGDLRARIAECRHARGDLDGAIGVLKEAIEGSPPPEDYHARVEALGSWYLERAGEPPELMV